MTHILNGNFIIPYKSFTFSGGEIQVKLEPANFQYDVDKVTTFHANIHSVAELFELALLTDAVDRWFMEIYNKKPVRHLILPYMPYARQDRVCAPGEALSLNVAASFINSLSFDQVTVSDPHSDVTPALLNNVKVIDLVEIFDTRFPANDLQNSVFVSPDAGANKKVLKLAQDWMLPMIRADKIRNVATGEIFGTEVYTEHLGDKNVLVVDDICDGGRTFIELAKVLNYKTDGKLSLYVTHGIFSKGIEVLREWYDKVYCPYVFPNVDDNERLIRI